MKRKPEEELIDLTTEATPWKKTENKTPGGTSVQLANCNSPAQQQVKKEFSPKKERTLTVHWKHSDSATGEL